MSRRIFGFLTGVERQTILQRFTSAFPYFSVLHRRRSAIRRRAPCKASRCPTASADDSRAARVARRAACAPSRTPRSCEITPSFSCASICAADHRQMLDLLLQLDALLRVRVEIDQRVLHFLERAHHRGAILLLDHRRLRFGRLDVRPHARVENRDVDARQEAEREGLQQVGQLRSSRCRRGPSG